MSDDADWWRYYWAGWDTWNGETPDSEPAEPASEIESTNNARASHPS